MLTGIRHHAPAVLLALCALAPASLGQVRISQVGKGSGLDPNAYNGNYVELYNTGSEAVSLAGKSLQWASSAAGAGWTSVNLEGTIAPGGYWLVRLTSTNAGPDPSVGFGIPFVADQNRLGFNGNYTSVVFGNSGGKVVLSDSTTVFTTQGCSAPDAAHVLDLVSWSTTSSTAGCHEGPAQALVPAAGLYAAGVGTTSVLRRCGGLQDANDNLADFTTVARPPRSSGYTGAIDVPAVGCKTEVAGQTGRGTTTGYAGQTVLFTAGAVACSGAIQSIAINLGAVGGSSSQALFDDGTHGDAVSGDGVYSFLYAIPSAPAAPLGTYLLPVPAVDTSGRVGQGQAMLIVAPPPPANDVCAGAEVIPPGPLPFFGSASGNLVSATPITRINTICTTNSGNAGTSRDVWFSFTPVEAGFYTVSTCNSVTAPGLFTSMATNLAIFDACPAEGSADLSTLSLACSTNTCTNFIGGGPSTIFGFFMNAGVPYLIRVARSGSGDGVVAGPFRLDIFSEAFGACCLSTGLCQTMLETSCSAAGGIYQGDGTTCTTSAASCAAPVPPANNECASSVPLTLGTPAAGVTYGASGTDISTCDNTTWDVWYTYTPEAAGNYRITVARQVGLETPAIAVYATCPPATDSNLACVNVPVQGATNALEFAGSAGVPAVIRVATHFSQRVEFSVVIEAIVPACRPDFNHDGDLNPDDLGDFITCYFTEPPCVGADFNGDNDVNPDDLGDFITQYFLGC